MLEKKAGVGLVVKPKCVCGVSWFHYAGSVFSCARLVLVRASPALHGRAAGGSCVGRASFVCAHAPVPPCGIQARRRKPANAAGLAEVAGAAVAAGPMCACVRVVVPRRSLAAASRYARPSCGGLVASAVSHAATALHHFFVGEPAGAPAGAQSSPEIRLCELRSRLGNFGALVSLVPLDFKSDQQTGSTARSPTTSTWQFDGCCLNFFVVIYDLLFSCEYSAARLSSCDA